ncbi:MAG: DNA polymerase III subunit delta [Planctomycetota bacterium]
MAKSTANRISALRFLAKPTAQSLGPICVVVGDDAFLRHEVRLTLGRELCAEQDADITVCEGPSAQLRDVLDALCERSLFGAEQRVVVVAEADPFVKQYREKLEDYVERPAADAVLILEAKTWPGNTRLAKATAKVGSTISCQVPQQGRELTEFTKQLKDWLIQLARDEYETELQRAAVDLMLELLPTEVGVLAQEVGKLSLLAGDRAVIDVNLVKGNVGSWRTRRTWDMIDAAAAGRADDALQQLDRLLAAGEEPHALLPQMASTFRKFAAAARVFHQAEQTGRRISLRSALERTGMPPFKLQAAEAQLKQIGRDRANHLYRWLLAADLELKGHNSAKDRARRVLETLVLRLAKQAKMPAADSR